jgi:hypothetical protein
MAVLQWRLDEGQDVVNDATVAGARLGHLHELVLREAGVNLEVLVLVRPRGVKHELFRHRDDQIGFTNRPAVFEFRRSRQVFWIAFFRAPVHPGGDRFNLSLGQSAVVFEMTDARVGAPGRHLA